MSEQNHLVLRREERIAIVDVQLCAAEAASGGDAPLEHLDHPPKRRREGVERSAELELQPRRVDVLEARARLIDSRENVICCRAHRLLPATPQGRGGGVRRTDRRLINMNDLEYRLGLAAGSGAQPAAASAAADLAAAAIAPATTAFAASAPASVSSSSASTARSGVASAVSSWEASRSQASKVECLCSEDTRVRAGM